MRYYGGIGVVSGRWSSNETVHYSDLDFVGELRYQNINSFLTSYFCRHYPHWPSPDWALGGLLIEWTTELTAYLRSGAALSFSGKYYQNGMWGFVAGGDPVAMGDSFTVIVPQDQPIAFDTGDDSDRIDLVQIRPSRVDYGNETRTFRDPVTGQKVSSLTYTKRKYSYDVEILNGTPGSGVAPLATAGWIKIAEVTVPAHASSIDQSKIKDYRDSSLWTRNVRRTIKCFNWILTNVIYELASGLSAGLVIDVSVGIAGTYLYCSSLKEFSSGHGTVIDQLLFKDGYLQGNPGKRYTKTTNTTLTVNSRYYSDGSDRLEFTLPSSSASGDFIFLADISGYGWKIKQGSGQSIIFNGISTVPGTRGYLKSKARYANVLIECISDNTTWAVRKLQDRQNMSGYVMGGASGGFSHDHVSRLSFSTETANQILDTLTYNSYGSCGVSDHLEGYCCGGGANTVNVLEFSTEAISTFWDTPICQGAGAGVNSPSVGYLMGGFNGASKLNTIDYINFLTSAVGTLATHLSEAKTTIGGGASSSTTGYSMGGGTAGGNSKVVEGLTFATELCAVVSSAELAEGVSMGAGLSGPYDGYVVGGLAGPTWTATRNAEGINFATNTRTLYSNEIASARSDLTGMSGPIKGYVAGGTLDTFDNIYSIDFTTIGSSVLSSALNPDQSYGAGIQGYN